ncbi:MAG: sulfite exporter TauE/SafE family protein [Tissierellia bacterium]|nr:sulfite exporter TauE/SafE family protein [Tissierellia bacterium]
MITTVIKALYYIAFVVAAGVFGIDLKKKKDAGEWEEESTFKPIATGFITNFGDTLGIGSFAPTVFLFKALKHNIPNKLIPGTMNVADTFPVLLEAIIFTSKVEVEPVTLAVLIGAAVIGSYLGAGFIAKQDGTRIQMIMGIALFVTAVLMILSHPLVNLFPVGGDAIGLTGAKLVIGAVGNFILGALMTAGIGLYAPCMAMVYLLGMSPAVAFPIMMGSCALLMPVASFKFIKEDVYAKKNSLWIALSGMVGVWVAYKFFSSLPMDYLKIMVIVVIIVTSIIMIRGALKARKEGVTES